MEMQADTRKKITVTDPATFNETWAAAFNSTDVENMLDLYEDDAVLAVGTDVVRGKAAISAVLSGLLQAPGKIVGKNNFCLVQGDLALLRADWKLSAADGTEMMRGATAEIIRRRADGTWLYVIDHASGASLPSVV